MSDTNTTVEEGYKIVYCALCRGMAMICPHCKNSSCNAGGCDKCYDAFENRDLFLELGTLPSRVDVVGQGMHRSSLSEEVKKFIEERGGQPIIPMKEIRERLKKREEQGGKPITTMGELREKERKEREERGEQDE